MSHVADVELQITDLDALEKAADAAGFELVLNDWQNADRAAYLRGIPSELFGTCDHKLRRKDAPDGAYEIGLTRVPGREGYTPLYDSYASGKQLEQALGGPGLPALKRGYAAQVAAKQLRRQGYAVKITAQADGRLRVRGTK
jgi:hypothetical protein